ncbi:MAG: M13 family peptidase [Flavobacteriaceae bacterium CG_4_8_14_3_um_filter_34_10]|nr:M13 family metallopeptidase [Flavobacteriia bacterium]OIP50497.1 MAG: endothelin-converting protein [Flavobacteriaceae bacterium CG2_30_34_30]PIQ17524.1 MAG: endothelin-converting protein [Flavobacteriaceae bacterium CG18_big_fil_WC_8_21_14_2_50_34_36]PIV48439.1 MAG: M13 family peptidase [Flavobacteriaceae bacterium CG02_land_8_20_14_3_00_34_13]PIX09354.1 MAG: M13 family peptidase [Flavobacteriaceae bacterium CG_4_8_14_3_um_filter_34_10]PIZ08074.1 MAG: M13 family peptidase [Flavobacteriacea
MTSIPLKQIAAVTLIAAISVACKTDKEPKQVDETIHGLNLAYLDTTVSPQDDFFRYVNGKWLDQNEIPEDQTSWGSFAVLRKQTDADVLNILKKAMDDPKLDKNSDQAKAVYMFQSIMDTVARNEAGINPVLPVFEKIEAINNIEDLQKYLTEMQIQGSSDFFGFGVGSDPKDSNRNVAYLGASRLGLPDKDYYLKEDNDSKEKREKYVAHITRMLQFLGDTEQEAAAQAATILAFETKLATPRMDRVDRRDARKRYNPRTIKELQAMVPQINWNVYLDEIGAKQLDTIIVSEVKYTESLKNLFAENKVSDWKTFLRWSAFNSAAGTLSMEIEKADWDFYSKTMSGAEKQRPLDERALSTVNGVLGEALGKLYVDEKFPPEAKKTAEAMISKVVEAYDTRIKALPWMTESTKEKALEKLHKINIKIGYPNQWKDYGDLEVKSVDKGGSYFNNLMAASAWNFNRDIEKLGKPVDKNEWFMAPQVVNAYYSPSFNEIVFPAAILQPPFYDYKADAAVNFGGIGAVIGHEISHGFDDSGSRFDSDGNLNNWWTDEDLKDFESLGEKFADQYSAIEVMDGQNINGKLSLGENIGDLGGTNAALDGLRLYLAENGDPGLIDGFTQEQRFFLSWATIWRIKYRDEAMMRQLKLGPHSPGNYRAWVPIRNLDAFHEAFATKEGDAMYLAPENRVKIW